MAMNFFAKADVGGNDPFPSKNRNIDALDLAYINAAKKQEPKASKQIDALDLATTTTRRGPNSLLSAASDKILFMNSQRDTEKMGRAFIEMMKGSDLAITAPRGR